MNWPWCELELSGPAELSEIRHAYARLVRLINREEDPEAFQRLHEAYIAACRIARDMAAAGNANGVQEERERPPQIVRRERERPSVQKAEWDFERLIGCGLRDKKRQTSKEPNRDCEKPLWEDSTGDSADMLADIEAWQELQRIGHMLEARRKKHPFRSFILELKGWDATKTNRERRNAVLKELYRFKRLTEEGSDLVGWSGFFTSKAFLCDRNAPDMIFGLEAIIAETPELDPALRLEIASAYGFFLQRPKALSLLPLYRLVQGEEAWRRFVNKKVAAIMLIIAWVASCIWAVHH